MFRAYSTFSSKIAWLGPYLFISWICVIKTFRAQDSIFATLRQLISRGCAQPFADLCDRLAGGVPSTFELHLSPISARQLPMEGHTQSWQLRLKYTCHCV